MPSTVSMLHRMTAKEVKTIDDFVVYAQQRLGCPYPTLKDQNILRSKTRLLFEKNPKADLKTLVHIVDFMKSRKKNPPRIWLIVEAFNEAWAAGAIPELKIGNEEEVDVELGIIRALNGETDPVWRDKLLGARGVVARRAILEAWERRNNGES